LSTDSRTIFQQALSDRYRIDRELGRGGMAVVYLAQDLRHGRPVALKVLHPVLAHALGPERFEREIQVAARLQHPHILTVLDSGDTAGQLWFTMPFVEGESLRSRLAREGQLPVADALRIAREAADALDYAHRHGIIHRDIKPDNILLSDSHALVADFGIARAIAAGGSDEPLTATGTSIGTAAYMSPEQAAGEREVDGRSDIFSLAIVLYEMLAGTTPYAAATPQVMIARRFTEDAESVRKHRPSVQEPVAHALQRALSRTAADRFPTARAFADALAVATTASTVVTVPATRPAGRTLFRQPILAALVAGLLIGGGFLFAWSRGGRTGNTTADANGDARGQKVVRIAVLPFQNLGDTADAYFADGVTDAVRGKLAGIEGFAVIARGSSEEYRGSVKSPGEIAAELGVHYLLTGTVRWVKQADGTSRVQVRPELVEIGDGTAQTRWDEPFNAPLTDVFEVQEQIAGQVSNALDVALGTPEQERLAERPTTDLEAYNLFLRGEEASQANDPANIRRAIAFYERAVARDTAFGIAWARLAANRAFLGAISTNPPPRAKIREALDRAMALAPDAPETYRARMGYADLVENNTPAAMAVAEEGLRHYPNESNLLRSLGLNKILLGDAEAGAELLQRAIAVDPRNVRPVRALGDAMILMGRFEESREPLGRALELAPNDYDTVQLLVLSWLAQGDLAGARRVFNSVRPAEGREGLMAYFAMYNDYYWLLDAAQQDTVMGLGVELFDGDAGSQALVSAQILHARGDTAGARRFAETASRSLERLSVSNPNPQIPALAGLALALQGRFPEARRQFERALADSVTMYPQLLAYIFELSVRAAMVEGNHDAALSALERWITLGDASVRGRARVHPEYAPLRRNPRFQRIVR
jgi:serine/threonine-protein kinase